MVQDMDGADPTGMARNTPSGGTPGIAPGTVVLITHDDVLWFETPREIHACDRVEDVSATLAAIETAARGSVKVLLDGPALRCMCERTQHASCPMLGPPATIQ